MMDTAAEVKEWPMLFAGDMVRSILSGQKTQTRRPVDWKNSTVLCYPAKKYWLNLRFDEAQVRSDNPVFMLATGKHVPGRDVHLSVPFAHPDDSHRDSEDLGWYRVRPKWEVGDRLWVRETFSPVHTLAGCEFNAGPENGGVRYRATWTKAHSVGWTPSIHMPRWACRLMLEITEVRVERVQGIIPADVIAEGCPYKHSGFDPENAPDWTGWYRDIWESMYGTWELNPWAWCLTFQIVS